MIFQKSQPLKDPELSFNKLWLDSLSRPTKQEQWLAHLWLLNLVTTHVFSWQTFHWSQIRIILLCLSGLRLIELLALVFDHLHLVEIKNLQSFSIRKLKVYVFLSLILHPKLEKNILFGLNFKLRSFIIGKTQWNNHTFEILLYFLCINPHAHLFMCIVMTFD